MNILKQLLKKNKVYFFSYDKNSFFEGLYRFFGILIAPLLININPNFISFLSLLSGFIGFVLYIFFSIKIIYIVFFFLFSFILDFTDGLIARFTNKTSFYGRFIDGLFDILVTSFLHIVFFIYLIENEIVQTKSIYFIIILVVIFLAPIQHLLLDRYAAIARWCNDLVEKKKIKPYIRDDFLGGLTKFLFDIQHLSIWLILFNYYIDNNILITLFFSASGIASILNLAVYIYLSKKNFLGEKNPLDNN